MARILVADDEAGLREFLTDALELDEHTVVAAKDGKEAAKLLDERGFDLVLTDLKMPGMDGMELLRRLRESGERAAPMPVIFLTSKDDELDEALGLAMGADDYIAKPFSQRLLIARVRAILRRTEMARGPADEGAADESENQLLERGRLVMDPARHKVLWDGKPVTLTVTEFLILEALATRPGLVKSRNQLLDVAYQDDVYVDDRTIDSHIKRVRRKCRAVDPDFDGIETLYGVGYRFGEE